MIGLLQHLWLLMQSKLAKKLVGILNLPAVFILVFLSCEQLILLMLFICCKRVTLLLNIL